MRSQILLLANICQFKNEMVRVLKHHQYDYQELFQELAKEIKETIGKNCNAIAEKEQKRLLNGAACYNCHIALLRKIS
jgi:hypothetical protein